MATFINMYFNRLLKFPKIESASKPVYLQVDRFIQNQCVCTSLILRQSFLTLMIGMHQ